MSRLGVTKMPTRDILPKFAPELWPQQFGQNCIMIELKATKLSTCLFKNFYCFFRALMMLFGIIICNTLDCFKSRLAILASQSALVLVELVPGWFYVFPGGSYNYTWITTFKCAFELPFFICLSFPFSSL